MACRALPVLDLLVAHARLGVIARHFAGAAPVERRALVAHPQDCHRRDAVEVDGASLFTSAVTLQLQHSIFLTHLGTRMMEDGNRGEVGTCDQMRP